MKNKNKTIEIFKPYLLGNAGYKGGKTLDEIKVKAKKIYKLSSNENLLGSSPKAKKALRKSVRDLNQYPDRTTVRLQNALSGFYKNELLPENFIAGNAGSEVIEHIIRAFLGEGLECIVSNPCFMPYVMFSEWQGAKIVDVPLLKPDYKLDIKGILNAVNDRTRLVFITSPNNPTGTYISKKEMDELVGKMPAHVVIVMDEVYYHFADADDYTTALPYVKAGKKIIAVNSFSKTYGLAALRTGYGYSTPELAGYVRQLSKPFLINKLTMNASIAALEDVGFVEKTVNLVQGERQRLYPKLDRIGIKYWKSQANFILFEPEMGEKEFEEKMLENGVMVRPVGNFGAPGCVRVTIGTKAANNAFVKALRKVLS
ncbi:MAG TPA: histidinol-phosphate transaminase [Bacteroidetes bacterium]|nr:histidinol-phosphate transaminase [Bacteroidota bacterium]